ASCSFACGDDCNGAASVGLIATIFDASSGEQLRPVRDNPDMKPRLVTVECSPNTGFASGLEYRCETPIRSVSLSSPGFVDREIAVDVPLNECGDAVEVQELEFMLQPSM
ncbi:MAG: hypothetical protein AAFP04_15290, partial [Myxococcota bacterium]